LLATAVYTEASQDERCEAHRPLEFVTEPVEQALPLVVAAGRDGRRKRDRG
jgi:hypothetical protein